MTDSPPPPELPEARNLDLDLADRYQAFSAELLRLSLVGIAAYGYLAKQLLSPESDPTAVVVRLLDSRWPLVLGLAAFSISASCALAHRYCSTDVIAHMAYISRHRALAIAGNTESARRADKERPLLRRDLKSSGALLLASSLFLAIGFITAAASFGRALWLSHT